MRLGAADPIPILIHRLNLDKSSARLSRVVREGGPRRRRHAYHGRYDPTPLSRILSANPKPRTIKPSRFVGDCRILRPLPILVTVSMCRNREWDSRHVETNEMHQNGNRVGPPRVHPYGVAGSRIERLFGFARNGK